MPAREGRAVSAEGGRAVRSALPPGPLDLRALEVRGGEVRRFVLHVHRNPATGVWAMMKHLARVQNREAGTAAVLGLPVDRCWRASAYMDELSGLDLPWITAPVPKLFGTGAFYLFILSNPLRRWLRRVRAALPEAEIVVHSHSAWLTGGYLPLPRRGRSALIATFHGIADDHRLRRIAWLRHAHACLARRLHRSGAVLTSVSREGTARAEAIFGIPRGAFHVVPNGMPRPETTARRRAGRKGGLLVGHVGQMHEGKGWHLLLEAVAELHRAGRPVKLVLAGRGRDAERAAAAAARHGAFARYLGFVPEAGASLIPRLDVLVLATWSEGMPMSVVEAFAAGVPVVATPVGGLQEMIRHEENGLFVERNASSIATALERLLLDPVLRERLGREARRTFEERFRIERVAAAYRRLYDAALAGGPGAPPTAGASAREEGRRDGHPGG